MGALAPVEYVRRISSQIAATRQKKQVDDLPEYLRPLMDTEQLTEDQVSFFLMFFYFNCLPWGISAMAGFHIHPAVLNTISVHRYN